LKRKWLAVGIILLFVETSLIPVIAQDAEKLLPSSRGNWLYVGGSGPGNYTWIQDAINASSDGDTVFVYDDSSPYFENLVINKSIVVLGEGRNSTVVDGGKNRDVVLISADNVYIEGFTIQHSGNWSGHCGFKINTSNNITISNNNIVENIYGISLDYSNNCAIKDNTFCRNQEVSNEIYLCSNTIISGNTIVESEVGLIGILLQSSTSNTISQNIIEHNQVGVALRSSDNSTIYNNIIRFNDVSGIEMRGGANNSIVENIIQSNNYNGIIVAESIYNTTVQDNVIDGQLYGIYLTVSHSKGISISFNTLTNNSYGIELFDSSLITISCNNFIKNDCNAYFKLLPFEKNLWSGNYWDDHSRIGSKVILGRVLLFSIEFPALYLYFEFRIPWVNFDWHPAQEPYDISGMS